MNSHHPIWNCIQGTGVLYTFGDDGHVFVLDARKAVNVDSRDTRVPALNLPGV